MTAASPALPDSGLLDGRAEGEPAFVVDLDGFEGPLDLLLDLARRQKVDLARISVAALARQYLVFIDAARRLRLELAADYLVMAAWLAYLKSRLLLPQAESEPDEDSAETLAAALAHRLRRLEAMRRAAERLAALPRLGHDVFARGMAEPLDERRTTQWTADFYDLLSAYARQAQARAGAHVTIRRPPVWPLAEARAALERLVGGAADWTRLDALLLHYLTPAGERRTVTASSFGAALELAREGGIEIRQERAFAPLWLRRRGER